MISRVINLKGQPSTKHYLSNGVRRSLYHPLKCGVALNKE